MHYDYRLVDEKLEAKKEIASNHQLQIIEGNNSSLGKTKILISNLSNNKENPLLKCKTLPKCRVAIPENS